MSNQAPRSDPPAEDIDTDGGAYVEGNVETSSGDFVGRDHISGRVVATGNANVTINEAERVYDVRGLPNPYIGLRAFTFGERSRYAGPARAIEATVRLVAKPGAQRTLVFVTGASGSGKSSFAQAGLLPALEKHYRQHHRTMRRAIFTPSAEPIAGLFDALEQLGLPAQTLSVGAILADPGTLYPFMRDHTPAGQINVLVVDQFEELFTQAEQAHHAALVHFLVALPAFRDLRTHIIATLRSDYLQSIFASKPLFDVVKQSVELRGMTEVELREAILRPVQDLLRRLHLPAGAKQFEPVLLARLARDAAEDAAYLPLLQVTLEDLWRRGSLTLGAYDSLTGAIQELAEEVYHYADAGGQREPRSEADQATIMQILMDLVEVSQDDDARRDVRLRRAFTELAHGSSDRARLIEELSQARLLSRGSAKRGAPAVETEVVDIIHESLLRNWNRLRDAIRERRHGLQRRVRFEQGLQEWLENARSEEYLLAGARLREARELAQQDDIVFRRADAQEFWKASLNQNAQSGSRLEHEAQVAREILHSVLPAALPSLPGWEFAAYHRPAHLVAGDFYDFVPLADSKLGIVVGDVSDKGVPAALAMAMTKVALRGAASQSTSAHDTLALANQLIWGSTLGTFATCFYAILDPTNGCLIYANAGHNLPLWRRSTTTKQLPPVRGIALGVLDDIQLQLEDETTMLEPGDCVVLFTDGLEAAINADEEEFGVDRLRQSIARSATGSADAIVKSTVDDFMSFVGPNAALREDLVIVVVRRSP